MENKINKQNLEESFKEVRKAYRLLFQFQAQILNLMRYIRAAYGLTFLGWFPKFSDAVRAKTNMALDLWPWDWLSMYYSEFVFQKVGFSLHIFIISDTGWFDKNINDENFMIAWGKQGESKLDLDNFEDIEKSRTQLIFLIETPEKKFSKSFDAGPKSDLRHYPEFFTKSEGGGKEKKFYWKKYDLSEFYDIDATNKILKEFAEKAREAGFENLEFKLRHFKEIDKN